MAALWAMIGFACGGGQAQVTVDARIDSLELFVGEQTHITLEVSADAKSKLVLPQFKAGDMLGALKISGTQRLKTLSKGTKEKVQLILAMSRKARLYLLDEPIGGVDPAAREYILNTIISNYSEDAAVVITTHLIGDIEQVLDEAVFLRGGQVLLHKSVDAIREEDGKSVNDLFREVFRC